MGADATLVQGAYNANKYAKSGVDAAFRRFGDSLNDGIGKLKSKKDSDAAEAEAEEPTVSEKEKAKEESKKASLDVIDENAAKVENEPGLNHPGDQKLIRDQAESWRSEYVNATPAQRKALMSDLDATAKTAGEFVNLKSEFAADWNTRNIAGGKSGEGLSASISTADEEFIGKLMDPANSDLVENRTTDEEGKVTVEYGIIGKDGNFMSSTQAQTYLDGLRVDHTSLNKIKDYRDAAKSTVDTADENTPFDRDSVGRDINEVVRNGNIRSLMYDNQFGNTSFMEDLQEGTLANPLTYTQLGMDEYTAKKYDNNNDGKLNGGDNLSKADMDGILDYFANSDDTLKLREGMVKDYYTAHVENQWNKAYKAKHGKPFGQPVVAENKITPGGVVNKVDGKQVWTPEA
jgi:hypothetical protein